MSKDTSDSLGDRMKRYESVSRHVLMSRCPVIVRVDGRAFHTLTRGLDRPFDSGFIKAMSDATRAVAEEMQGCRLAYTQSDEASFLLLDTDTLETQPWFDYDLWKVVSISAATMTGNFICHAPLLVAGRIPTFDSRAFNVPLEEVANYFLWRAKDWKRNSIQMCAQSHFSPKQLHGKKQPDMLAMLAEKGVAWWDLPSHLRCGKYFLPKEERWLENIEPTFPDVDFLIDQVAQS